MGEGGGGGSVESEAAECGVEGRERVVDAHCVDHAVWHFGWADEEIDGNGRGGEAGAGEARGQGVNGRFCFPGWRKWRSMALNCRPGKLGITSCSYVGAKSA